MYDNKSIDILELLPKNLDSNSLYLKLAKEVVNYPFFQFCSASLSNHHYGTAGLQYHTWDVIRLCLANAAIVGGANIKILYFAALFHDIGKTFDYYRLDGPSDSWSATIHKRKIHHISRSCFIFNSIIESEKYDGLFNVGEIDHILHIILSHHGQKEWGSPVQPQTKEAWILHLCDSLSARCDDLGIHKK